LRHDHLEAAVDALRASAVAARSQHALVELGQTLALLTQVGRQRGDSAMVAQAEAERAGVVEHIGPEVRGQAWAQGVPGLSRGLNAARAADPVGPLTPREREVAALIARGMINRQIAETLVISDRTAENHVSNILSKLGLQTRAQVAVWAIQHGLGASSTAPD
jgi:DNA-binding NarL/FixJ family response regulator